MARQTAEEVKSHHSLKAFVERDVAWDRAKSQPARGIFWALCPFHTEKTPSFQLREAPGEIGRFQCFGCGMSGSMIDYVMLRDHLNVAAAIEALGENAPVDPKRVGHVTKRAISDPPHAARNRARAVQLWRGAIPGHPLLAAYLAARGINLDKLGGIPPTLRLHPDLPFWENGSVVHTGPAMLAFIGRERLVGVHRTWITAKGRARFASGTKIPKKMLGETGALFGAPVVLTKPERPDLLIVGEGIETTLAALTSERWLGRVQAEAALSLSALAGPGDAARATTMPLMPGGKRFPTPNPDLGTQRPGYLPQQITEAVILADPSAKAPIAAQLLAERAREKFAQVGVRTTICVPLNRWDHDADFTDLAAGSVS